MNQLYIKRRSFILLFALLISVFQIYSAKSVKLSLPSSAPISVGGKFSIDIVVTDINAVPEISRNTKVPGAKVLYFTDTESGSQTSMVNGKTSSSFYTRYTLYLQATAKGNHTFGPITVGGVRSNSLKFNVGSGSQPSQQAASAQSGSGSGPSFIGTGNGNLFLRASLSKTSAFEQEAVVYTVKLYSSYSNIRFVGATAAPKFEGFVIEESKDVSQQLTFESYNGRQYASAVIARYVIFPQMAGNLKVLGNTYTVSVDEREYYNDPYYGRISTGRPLQLNVKPNDLTLNVKSLPQPQPADFSGGVGNFTISASIPNKAWKTNIPSSVVYTVSGSGNLKYVKLPELNNVFPKEVEVFSPETKVNATVSGGTVKGSARFDYSVVPLEVGKIEIPKVSFVYFDPVSATYRTAYAQGFTLDVGKGAASSKSQTNTHLKFLPDLMKVGSLSFNHPPIIYQAWYWIGFISPIVVLIVVFMVQRAKIKENADIVSLKSRKAGKMAARRLKKAAIYLKEGDAERFFDEILASLWGYASDKLKMPTSELSRENISGRFESEGVPQALSARFIAIVNESEFAKYSPQKGAESMQRIYDESASVLESIESSLKSRKNGK